QPATGSFARNLIYSTKPIMFCNKLLLTKNDRLPFYVVTEVARAIHPLNPQVAIMAVPWGNLQLDELLSMPDYD
ncbi:hypothetical protein QIG78_26470, partial [Klebsiella pneumoniae]|nr:hypothetical protein [Klebsiella pneumoniae]